MDLSDVHQSTPQGTSYRVKRTCRLCGGALEKILDLGQTPLANELLATREASLEQERFPLWLSECESCGHVQMPVVVDPERLFRNYRYVSGTGKSFVLHLEAEAICLIGELRLQEGDLVVEIGSNDGTFLRFFQDRGMWAVGVDPATEIANRATSEGIVTFPDFFDAAVAEQIQRDYGQADLVVANNVMAHAEDLGAILDGVKRLLAPEGAFVFEVAYLFDMLESGAFDLVYHEHLSFHHARPLLAFLRRHGLEAYRFDRVSPQGGSLRVYARHRSSALDEPDFRALHELDEPLIFPGLKSFVTKAINAMDRLQKFFSELADDHLVVGYGCPAKLSTLAANVDNLTSAAVEVVMEDNPLKHGLYVPGTDIPIASSDTLLRMEPPDYVVVFAWNFADDVVRKFGNVPWKWVVPFPEWRVVDGRTIADATVE